MARCVLLYIKTYGAVAQMGERMTGSHEARGSIPLSSTNKIKQLGRLSRRPISSCFLEISLNAHGNPSHGHHYFVGHCGQFLIEHAGQIPEFPPQGVFRDDTGPYLIGYNNNRLLPPG